MLQLKRQAVEIQVEESDLITPKDAADISGRSLQTILSLMASDTLPIYMLPGDKRKRPQRFTSKKAVQKMGKKK
jgi:hypothetical protein